MCFTINNGICPEPLIAEKRIKVYKVLEKLREIDEVLQGEPIYKKFIIWIAGKVTRSSIKFEEGETYGPKIGEGLHAYRHLDQSIETASWGSNRYICECFVPVGGTYYFNKSQVVSSQMIWTGRVWSLTSKRWVKFGHKVK